MTWFCLPDTAWGWPGVGGQWTLWTLPLVWARYVSARVYLAPDNAVWPVSVSATALLRYYTGLHHHNQNNSEKKDDASKWAGQVCQGRQFQLHMSNEWEPMRCGGELRRDNKITEDKLKSQTVLVLHYSYITDNDQPWLQSVRFENLYLSVIALWRVRVKSNSSSQYTLLLAAAINNSLTIIGSDRY